MITYGSMAVHLAGQDVDDGMSDGPGMRHAQVLGFCFICFDTQFFLEIWRHVGNLQLFILLNKSSMTSFNCDLLPMFANRQRVQLTTSIHSST